MRIAKTQRDSSNKSVSFYPLQLDFNNTTRLLYFDSKQNQKECMELILREQGFESLLDMFELLEQVGDGASAEVMLA